MEVVMDMLNEFAQPAIKKDEDAKDVEEIIEKLQSRPPLFRQKTFTDEEEQSSSR
jgi:proline dehydrogenase